MVAAHILAEVVDHTLVDAAARNPVAAVAHSLADARTVVVGHRNLVAVRSFAGAEDRNRAAGYRPAAEDDPDFADHSFAGYSLVEEAVVRKLPADCSFVVVVARNPVAAADTKDACQGLADSSSRPFCRNWDRWPLIAFS